MRSEAKLGGLQCLIFGVILLTGCDLLGLGPKKQDNTQNQTPAPAAVAAPVASSPVQPVVSGPIPPDALVRIGQWTLTADEFNNRLTLLKQQLPEFKENDPNTKNAVLDELVRQELMVKEAEDSDLGDSKEIKDAIEDFRKTLLVQDIAGKLTKDVVATEDNAREYYEANKEKFTEPITWNVSEIVVGDETSAKNILVQVLQGGDFAQIAQAQSKAADAAQGGKLKPFVNGKAPFDAMQIAIANLDEGGISGVFKGPEGSYIVKVDSKTGGKLQDFTTIKEKLIYALTMQKQQNAILSHLRDLADKYKPEYNKDLIEQTVGK